ncbi:MAG: hypothetical protein ABSA53_28615 [Streptosporangiaceae bacterium]|jgi:hypothetical protein
MSDPWIFSATKFMYGTFLAAEILKVVVMPVELESMDDLSGPAPQEQIQLAPLRDYSDLVGQVRDIERQAPQQEQEVVRNAPPEAPDEARQPPGEGSPLKKLNEMLKDTEEGIEKLTKPVEPDPMQTAHLLAARQEELKELLAKQVKERDGQAEKMAGSRKEMETRYADSPLEQERHLANFDKAAESAVTAMAGRHDKQLRQFEERWQQKLEQLQAQPQIMPIAPGYDHR